MDAVCYVCNQESHDWRRNFTEIKSQHTQTSISEFIRKFLGDSGSLRDIDNESNCICVECLLEIDEYDRLTQQVIEQETKLRNLLLATETKHFDIKGEFIEIDADPGNCYQSELNGSCDMLDVCENDSNEMKTESDVALEGSIPTELISDLVACTSISVASEHLPSSMSVQKIGGKRRRSKSSQVTSLTTATQSATTTDVAAILKPNKNNPIADKQLTTERPNESQLTCVMCDKTFDEKSKYNVSRSRTRNFCGKIYMTHT